MPKAVISPETERLLFARKAALTSLVSHPNWEELEAEAERKVKKIERIVLALTTGAPGGTPIPENELLYWRGFINGMRWLVAVPRGAENTLERFLKQQGLTDPREGAEE